MTKGVVVREEHSFMSCLFFQLQKHLKTTFFCLNFIILLLSYWRFFKVHYSADTYVVYSHDESLVSIINSRPLGYVAGKLNYFFNLNQADAQWFVTLLFLLVISVCVAYLACSFCAISVRNEVSKRIEQKSEEWVNMKLFCVNISSMLVIGAVIDLAVLVIFVNGFFLDWMRFPECYIQLYAPSIVLITLAFLFTFYKKADEKRHARWIKVAIMLLLASWFYQAVLFIYLQLVLGALLICSTNEFRSAIKDAIVCLLVVVVVGVLSIVISKLVFKSFVHFGLLVPEVSLRKSVSSLTDIKENVLFVASNFKSLMLNGYGNAPKCLLPVSFLVASICLLFKLARAYSKKVHIIVAMVYMAVVFMLAFSTQFITKDHDLSPRTLVGIYVALSVFLIVGISIKGRKHPVNAISAIVIGVVLFANLYICNVGTKAELALNGQERIYCDLVQGEIDEYESASGNEITKIIRATDAAPSKNMEDIGCEPFDSRNWNIGTTWSTTYMINFYEGRNYTNEEMTVTDKERLFGNVNYDSFDAGKQMVFEGDALYLLVY